MQKPHQQQQKVGDTVRMKVEVVWEPRMLGRGDPGPGPGRLRGAGGPSRPMASNDIYHLMVPDIMVPDIRVPVASLAAP